jgi:hypothetical protein
VAREISNPLPLKDVLQTVERQIVSELAGHDVSQQPRPSHTLLNSRLRLGRYFHPRVVTIALTTNTGILLAHVMDALEAARKILNLPTLIGTDLMARLAAAGTGPLFGAQLIHARGDRKIFEVGKVAPPFAPLHPPQWLLLLPLGRNIVRMNRFTVQLLGEVQQQLRESLGGLKTIRARTVVPLLESLQLQLQTQQLNP